MKNIVINETIPKIGLPGGSLSIIGSGFEAWDIANENLMLGGKTCWIKGVSDTEILTTIPKGSKFNELYIDINGTRSNSMEIFIPATLCHGLYMVDNPVVSGKGDIFATYSGGKGETTMVSVYKVLPSGNKEAYIHGIINATSLAVDKNNNLYVSSRYNGKVYISRNKSEFEIFCQGLGDAFGLAINSHGELFVGDRNGTIFQISDNQAMFFASIPQSYIGFHLAFDSDDNLFVSNPVHMGENFIYKIDPSGRVETYYEGYSLFHGFTFDKDNNIILAEGKRGENRIIRISPDKKVDVLLTGQDFIGAAFDNEGNLLAATTHNIYKIPHDKLN